MKHYERNNAIYEEWLSNDARGASARIAEKYKMPKSSVSAVVYSWHTVAQNRLRGPLFFDLCGKLGVDTRYYNMIVRVWNGKYGHNATSWPLVTEVMGKVTYTDITFYYPEAEGLRTAWFELRDVYNQNVLKEEEPHD